MAAQFEYQFSTTTSEPPTGSQVRLDSADAAAATKLWARYTTTPGEDVYRMLIGIDVDDELYLQDWDDHTRFAHWRVTAPAIDKGDYVELAVESLLAEAPLLGQKVAFVVVPAADVSPTPLTPPGDGLLCTVEEVTAALKLQKEPDPAELTRVIAAASDAIRLFTKREFGLQVDETRTVGGSCVAGGGWYVPLQDTVVVRALSGWDGNGGSVELEYATVPSPERGWPPLGVLLALRPLAGLATVDATWGWPEVPDDVHYAAIQQSCGWYTLDSSRLSDSWADELQGMRRQPAAPRGLLFGVQDTLRRYRSVSMA